MYSFTEENYLKAIYKLSPSGEEVSTNALAEELQTKAASVTDMLRKLAEKGLIHYEKYRGVSLSGSGSRVAISVVRKHRLWEVFLHTTLRFGWEEVHEIAEQLEHIQSDKLITRLDEFLGFPKYDPHGDPIPDSEGRFQKSDFVPLSGISLNAEHVLTGVSDHSAAFLLMLEKWGLKIGTRLRLIEKNEFDGSIELELTDGKRVFLAEKTAVNILVKRISA